MSFHELKSLEWQRQKRVTDEGMLEEADRIDDASLEECKISSFFCLNTYVVS
jgi:hypothetical protein